MKPRTETNWVSVHYNDSVSTKTDKIFFPLSRKAVENRDWCAWKACRRKIIKSGIIECRLIFPSLRRRRKWKVRCAGLFTRAVSFALNDIAVCSNNNLSQLLKMAKCNRSDRGIIVEIGDFPEHFPEQFCWWRSENHTRDLSSDKCFLRLPRREIRLSHCPE